MSRRDLRKQKRRDGETPAGVRGKSIVERSGVRAWYHGATSESEVEMSQGDLPEGFEEARRSQLKTRGGYY